MWKGMSEETKSAYGKSYMDQRLKAMDAYYADSVKSTQPVIEAYTNALLDVFPQKRYCPMDLFYRIRVFVATHLPEIFHDKLFINYIQPESVRKD